MPLYGLKENQPDNTIDTLQNLLSLAKQGGNPYLTPELNQPYLGLQGAPPSGHVMRDLGTLAAAINPKSWGGRLGAGMAGNVGEYEQDTARNLAMQMGLGRYGMEQQKFQREMEWPQKVEEALTIPYQTGMKTITAPGATEPTTSGLFTGMQLNAPPISAEIPQYTTAREKIGKDLGPLGSLAELQAKYTGKIPDEIYSGVAGASPGVIHNMALRFMQQDPSLDYITAASLARTMTPGTTYLGGQVRTIPGAPTAVGEMKYGEKMGGQKAEIETTRQIELEKKLGEKRGEFIAAAPKVRNTLQTLNQQWDLVDNVLEDTINTVIQNRYTAGLIGANLAKIPGTTAFDLSEKLKTIQANVGFDKLQDMRANSPTGGALGQVSDLENKLLQAVKGSMAQGQSAAQLIKNLRTIQNDLRTLKRQKNDAFKMDYEGIVPTNTVTEQTTASSTGDLSNYSDEQLIKMLHEKRKQ